MNRYTLCLALCFGLSISLFAQTKIYTLADTTLASTLLKESIDLNAKGKYEAAYAEADSAQMVFEKIFRTNTLEIAMALHQQGRSLYYLSKYDDAIKRYEKSLTIRLELMGENNLDVARSFNNIGLVYQDKQNTDKAIEYLEKASKIRVKILGYEHIDVAYAYANLGINYYGKGNYEQAIDYFERSLSIKIKKLGADNLEVANTYNNLSVVYNNLGNYDKAIQYNETALSTRLKHLDSTHIDIATSYNNLGNIYHNQENYKKSKEFHTKSLQIRLYSLGDKHQDVADSYNNLGVISYNFQDYHQAIKYHLKALNIYINIFGADYIGVASSYNNLGNNYDDLGDYDKAIEYHNKALATKIKLLDAEHQDIGSSFNNLGNTYSDKGDYNKAIEYSEKGLAIKIKALGLRHIEVGSCYNNIGFKYFKLKNYDKAIEYFKNAIDIYADVTTENKGSLTRCYNNIGSAYERQQKFDTALICYKKALKSANYTQKNTFSNVDDVQELTRTLLKLQKFHIEQYYRNKDKFTLFEGVFYVEQAINATIYQNNALYTEGSKIQLLNENYDVYEGAIQSTLLLADENNNDTLLKTAFNYAEQSKASVLQAQIKEADALRFADIPDTLLQREYSLRVDITWREKQRQEKINAGRAETDSLVLDISSKLFDVRQQYEALKSRFEREFPQYYRLKYDLNTVNVADVQQKLLATDQTLLSYFVGDSSIFTFVVNKNAYTVQEIKKGDLDSLVKQLRFSMYDNRNAEGVAYEKNARNYTEIAYKLYEKLILPIKKQLQTNLVIVPDGVLGYIPFEALLVEKPTANFDRFQLHHYLLKDYNISYNYSATLWQEMKTRKNVGFRTTDGNNDGNKPKSDISKPTSNGGLLAFAPTFGKDTNKIFLDSITDFALRTDPLMPLKHNIPEVQAIQKIMGGKVFSGKFATKAAFLTEAAKYRIIHLATHGKADDRIGEYAFLAFQNANDTLDSDRLYVKDLYNCTLDADLVVLSACETGIGKWQRGEGIISLARAFAYAGTKSIVTSLWGINDGSTKTLMTAFYKNLKRGLAKDAALRQAKLDYLSQNAADNAAPFHWAAFIAIGDMQAVKK